MGMRNMAKKRAPTFVVAVAMALPTTATSIRHTMWIARSPVRADVHVTKMETRKVANYHGIIRPCVSPDMCAKHRRTGCVSACTAGRTISHSPTPAPSTKAYQ